MREPTIYEALKAKLGREPTGAEIKAEVNRVIAEGNAETMMDRAERGRLPWQKKR